jgi:hypothetical protein
MHTEQGVEKIASRWFQSSSALKVESSHIMPVAAHHLRVEIQSRSTRCSGRNPAPAMPRNWLQWWSLCSRLWRPGTPSAFFLRFSRAQVRRREWALLPIRRPCHRTPEEGSGICAPARVQGITRSRSVCAEYTMTVAESTETMISTASSSDSRSPSRSINTTSHRRASISGNLSRLRGYEQNSWTLSSAGNWAGNQAGNRSRLRRFPSSLPAKAHAIARSRPSSGPITATDNALALPAKDSEI